MSTIVNALPISLQSGSQIFGPVNVPNGTSVVTARLARCTAARPAIWPNEATTVALSVEISTDNGNSFQFLCAFASAGGILHNRDGSDAPESVIQCSLPSGNNRKLRTVVAVQNGPLDTELTVETS